MSCPLILASGSPARQKLLKELGLKNFSVLPQNTDETPLKKERPCAYLKRVTRAKLEAAVSQNEKAVILAADTIVTVGLRIIRKSATAQEQRDLMQFLSGRRNKTQTCVMLWDPHAQKIRVRMAEATLRFKVLTAQEIDHYVDSNVWQGCAGYAFNATLQSYTQFMAGSYSCILGLPLFETKNLLTAAKVNVT